MLKHLLSRLYFLVCCCFLLFACSQQPVFHDSSGHKLQFSDFHGKWVLVNYWASWCHACKEEIPALNQFYQKNKDKVIVLGVNYDGLQAKALIAAIDQFDIAYPVLIENPMQALKLKETGVVPTTYVINPQGKFSKALLGPQTEESLAQATILSAKIK